MAEHSQNVNTATDTNNDGSSQQTNDVFVDASQMDTDTVDASDVDIDSKIEKPKKKKRRVHRSKGSNSASSEVGVEVEEDKECSRDEREGEEEGGIETFGELLSDYKSLKKEIEQLKLKKTDSLCDSVTYIVKDIVNHMLTDIKKQISSDLNIDGVNSAMRTYVKKMNINGDKTEKIEKQLNKLTERGVATADVRVSNVSHDVIDRVKHVELKVVDLEARSRRNNLVFHGVSESPDEDCIQVALDLFDRGCLVTKEVTIERAHRIGGRKRGIRNRPLIVKFLQYQDKLLVQRGRKYLPKDISMSDDFPQEIRNARQGLVQQLIEEKREGHYAYIRYPATLVVNGEAVRTEPIQPITLPVDRHTPNNINNNNNDRNSRVNNDNAEQTFPHVPWSTAGSRGKHRHSPERQSSGRSNNRETRDRGAQLSSHNTHNDYNNNNNKADRDQPLWFGDARRQLGQRINTQPVRRENRDHRDERQTRTRNNNNNISVNVTGEREDGEWSDASQGDDVDKQYERRDYRDQHNTHRRVRVDAGASFRNPGSKGGQRVRRGESSWNDDRQGNYNRRM